MSLPHLTYACDHCSFYLSSGPDVYSLSSSASSRTQLWGGLCACGACGTLHLVANTRGCLAPAERCLYFLVTHEHKHTGRSWEWRESAQRFELLPAYATGAERRAESVDISKARCTGCGRNELKLSLYHGIDCPACTHGKLVEEFTG
jgi:hypothetical protein